MTALLDVAGVGHSYGDREVLRDISFTLAPGTSLAIVGPSGSGKSTLLNIIATFLRPDAGRVVLDGVDAYAARERQRKSIRCNTLGFVFQQSHLIDWMTVEENVAVGVQYHGASRRGLRLRPSAVSVATAVPLLKAVGLSHRLGALPNELSGGEAQRVAIARAIVSNPPLVLADEPTGNLDRESAEAVRSALLDPPSTRALVMVTHDPAAARWCDETFTLPSLASSRTADR